MRGMMSGSLSTPVKNYHGTSVFYKSLHGQVHGADFLIPYNDSNNKINFRFGSCESHIFYGSFRKTGNEISNVVNYRR